ncbi:MAG: cytochrome [Ferruginibacter sp.]|nr:cytochrome [Ferruginibacter sp.]
MRFLKKFLLVLLVIFLLIQFYPRAKKNVATAASGNEISAKFTVPENVQSVLKVSCYDCHSNNTVYPWYSHIQPVSWWLNNHIVDGKKELNFSEFSSYSLRKQYKKLEEIGDQVEHDEMPLSSYTLIHTNAKLNADQKALLINWSKAMMDTMKAHYPADSLLRKK